MPGLVIRPGWTGMKMAGPERVSMGDSFEQETNRPGLRPVCSLMQIGLGATADRRAAGVVRNEEVRYEVVNLHNRRTKG